MLSEKIEGGPFVFEFQPASKAGAADTAGGAGFAGFKVFVAARLRKLIFFRVERAVLLDETEVVSSGIWCGAEFEIICGSGDGVDDCFFHIMFIVGIGVPTNASRS